MHRVRPFPTNLIAEHIRDSGLRAAALTYGVNLTITACFFGLFWFYAARGGAWSPTMPTRA